MAVTTTFIWNEPPLPQEVIQQIITQIDLMTEQNKTDGTWVRTENTPTEEQATVVRTWADMAAAQEWIDWVQQNLGIQPVSVEILEN
jgi:hypothetical protein